MQALTDEERGLKRGIVACAVITVTAAAGFVALRFHTRWKIVKMVGAEDWFILASLLFSIGTSIGLCIRESRLEFRSRKYRGGLINRRG
jgi:hypothetical protein